MISACSKTDFSDIDGNRGAFSDYHGKWLVINYWATWCKPCLQEIPELNQFADKHADTVKLFAVDFDQSQGDALIASSEKMGISFSVLTADPAPILQFEPPTVLPTTIIFNPKGQLHRTLLGPQTAESLRQAMALTQ